ncbi:hypothetical protein ACLKA6_019459 [Drosophila palustris]
MLSAKMTCQRKLNAHTPTWLIGGLIRYFLHVNRNKSFKPSRIRIWVGWIFSLTVMFPATQVKATNLTMLEQACYYTLTRMC